MPKRTGEAEWHGGLKDGDGRVTVGSGLFDGPYSFRSRVQDAEGTNPEELIGAAHASCFSMALSMLLENAGYDPESVHTDAAVELEQTDEGIQIARVELTTRAVVADISGAEFEKHADEAKRTCPVSRALAVPIELDASLDRPTA